MDITSLLDAVEHYKETYDVVKEQEEESGKKVYEGIGNVFADLGLPQPKDRQAKAMIAIDIKRLIDQAGWTQAEAAQRMGLSQSDVSNIVKGRLSGFSLARLFQCLDNLDQEI